jgi:hypothetical protein
MSTVNDTSISNQTSPGLSTPISRSVPFGILTTLIVPSILCYLFIFVQYFRKHMLHKHIHSHIIFIVLVFGFVQVSFTCFYLSLIHSIY